MVKPPVKVVVAKKTVARAPSQEEEQTKVRLCVLLWSTAEAEVMVFFKET